MVQRLRLHAAPQERALPVLQPKRTKSFDIIEHIIENGRLQKELPAPERGQAAIVDSAGLRDSQREPNVSAPRLQGRARTTADRASAVTSANASGRKSAASETHPASGQAANGGAGAPQPALAHCRVACAGAAYAVSHAFEVMVAPVDASGKPVSVVWVAATTGAKTAAGLPAGAVVGGAAGEGAAAARPA